MRRYLALLTVCAGLVSGVSTAFAHHGWAWTTGKNLELTGRNTKTKLGNPHGLIEVQVGNETWSFEVGQPWRNARAGLKDGDLAEGVEVRVVGEPAADPDDKRLKVERLYIGDHEYVLYPERD